MMGAAISVLASLLCASVLLNIYQVQRWNAYRSKPSGNHSYTSQMPAVRVTRDKE